MQYFSTGRYSVVFDEALNDSCALVIAGKDGNGSVTTHAVLMGSDARAVLAVLEELGK